MKVVLSVALTASILGGSAGFAGAMPVRRLVTGPGLTVWAPTATQAMTLAGARDMGPAPANATVHLAIALNGRFDALKAAIRDVYNPASRNYQHFYTPAQFNATFAPTPSEVNAVESYLSSFGIGGFRVTPNRLFVSADTDVATAQRAFNTQIHAIVREGSPELANVTPAQVPASLSGIVTAVGGVSTVKLHTFYHATPLSSTVASEVRRASAMRRAVNGVLQRGRMSSPPGCPQLNVISIGPSGPIPKVGVTDPACFPRNYTPIDYRIAYDDQGNPTGQNVGIADFTISSDTGPGSLADVIKDLWEMDRTNGIPTTYARISDFDGDTSAAGTGNQNEWDLDVQSAVGMAGGVSEMVLYNAPVNQIAEIPKAVSQFDADQDVRLLNLSIGSCEAFWYVLGLLGPGDFALAQAVVEGKTVTVATGDAGSFCPPPSVPTLNLTMGGLPDLEYPATSPYATAVGGTTLFTSNADGSYVTETAWNAGSGGMSLLEPQSPWQSAMAPSVQGQKLNRFVPDVAMNADPLSGMYTYVSGKLFQTGGTSLAAPIVNGIYARIISHHPYFGNATPYFYALYTGAGGGMLACNATCASQSGATPNLIGPFHDVVVGDNGFFQSTPGFDLNTGMGTIDINRLFVAFGS